jgi:hypothetical protein
MLAVEFSSGCEFSLVLGFETLLAIPPGTAAIEVIPNVRRADDWHFSPQRKSFAVKANYSTNFLILSMSLRATVRSEAISHDYEGIASSGQASIYLLATQPVPSLQ